MAIYTSIIYTHFYMVVISFQARHPSWFAHPTWINTQNIDLGSPSDVSGVVNQQMTYREPTCTGGYSGEPIRSRYESK